MPTALTGSLGWSGLHPFQPGGPPLVGSYTRPLPTPTAGPQGAEALPLTAHAYGNDGVTPATTATFGILARPSLKAKTTNGGYDQITLEVAAPIAGLVAGNVVRLTELGGPWAGFLYSGIVEGFPDTRSATATTHGILLSPFAIELTRASVQLLYLAAVDVAQIVRDAVAVTLHCDCDQLSVPATTGIYASVDTSGQVDFRGQTVNQVLDTCRAIAGPTWYWYCDELGRVWFQSQGSAANYTFMGVHVESRTTNGGEIVDRVNQVVAIGGVPTGGSANITATANGASQSTIGIRSLQPPLQVPGVTDQTTLTAIANGILATLDQTWTRVSLVGLPPTGQANEHHPGRVHGSHPGGAMIRYHETARSPMPESAAGAGYTGPYIAQQVTYDGLHQEIEAGNTPVTSQTDIADMVAKLVRGNAANAVYVTAAPLNQPGVVPASGGLAANTVASLGYSSQSPGQSITSVAFVALSPSIAVTFTLTRTAHCLIMFSLTAKTSGGSGTFANARVNVIQSSTPNALFASDKPLRWDKGAAGETTATGWLFTGNSQYAALAAGTYVAQIEVSVDSGQTCLVDQGYLEVFQCGT